MSKKFTAPKTVTPKEMYEKLSTFFMENTQLVKNTCKNGGILNVIYPKVPKTGITPRITVKHVKTKENPTGCFYDPETNRMIVRLFFNKDTGLYTFMKLEDNETPDDWKYDTYCWNDEVFEAETDKLPINVRSTDGLMNLYNLLNLMENDEEKRALCDDIRYELFGDFYLCKSKADMRLSIEITNELFYDLGLTHVIDEWVDKPQEDGTFELTELSVGDRLIWTIKRVNGELQHSFYRCAQNVYLDTYEDLATPFEGIEERHIK